MEKLANSDHIIVIKIQAAARDALHTIFKVKTEKELFQRGKFTVGEVSYPEELDMPRSAPMTGVI